ncbi:hypothetical protein K1T71_004356 [Dendrolimus kikuchii]|uniref:Uncharacterized protein n=1 Tax=Dendrolimus kikuchii TaxID=765133 RepID=A0ACC1D7I4_9NEOP|nr:hypothetical protein K1T71_004356 [Dendrolimus kikuchii]
MGKCKSCNKVVTKKTPELECKRCGGTVHANTVCTELSNKQINLLKSADNLEWTCNDCKQKSPFRKSSFTAPEDETEDDDDTGSNKEDNLAINTSKLLSHISAEIEKSLKRELRETNQSLQFLSDKVDDYLELMETFKEKIKDLENKNCELMNKNKNLNTKIEALEQRINEIQQKQLAKQIEVAGIPMCEGENLKDIAKNLASKLNMKVDDIKMATRIYTKKGKQETILLKMKEELSAANWIGAARSKSLIASDVAPAIEASKSSNKLFVRPALTQHSKNLLWKSEQALKDSYKYIWCKNGKVLVRKSEDSKILTLRSENDIANLQLQAEN